MTLIKNIIGGSLGLTAYLTIGLSVLKAQEMLHIKSSTYSSLDPYGVGDYALFLVGGGASFVVGSWLIPEYLPE